MIANVLTVNNSSSFKYKASLLDAPVAAGGNSRIANTKIVVPLKYLSNFFRSLEMLLINCKIHLDLSTVAGNTKFIIKDTKLYVLVGTLSKEDNLLKILLSNKIKDFRDQFIGMSINQEKKSIMQLTIYTM